MIITHISSRHTGIPVATYTLMHADEVVAVAYREPTSVEVKLPGKLPFGLRVELLDFEHFMDWLRRRVDNLQRTYMNKVYIARKVGREFENILRDSCALSITDQFWVRRSDIDITWEELQQRRDMNTVLAEVALSGNTANLDWEAVMKGATSLFATKGSFPKALLGNRMRKLGGTQEREWVACVIGKVLGLPVQDAVIANPSLSGHRYEDGEWMPIRLRDKNGYYLRDANGHDLYTKRETDDTLVEISLFTSDRVSLVHASELFVGSDFENAHREGQHHRYFYDRLPSEAFKREFERVLILNWLISNHDMHGENFGCLYSPTTFELIGVSPSFDHNSADFDGTMPELDVPDIIKNNIQYHGDVIAKIDAGQLDTALEEVMEWLTQEQKKGVRAVGAELVNLYKSAIRTRAENG